MKVTREDLEILVALARGYGASRLILFGSALDTHANARDVDLACDGVTGWKLYELAARMEDTISASVDLIPLTPRSRFTDLIEETGRVLL